MASGKELAWDELVDCVPLSPGNHLLSFLSLSCSFFLFIPIQAGLFFCQSTGCLYNCHNRLCILTQRQSRCRWWQEHKRIMNKNMRKDRNLPVTSAVLKLQQVQIQLRCNGKDWSSTKTSVKYSHTTPYNPFLLFLWHTPYIYPPHQPPSELSFPSSQYSSLSPSVLWWFSGWMRGISQFDFTGTVCISSSAPLSPAEGSGYVLILCHWRSCSSDYWACVMVTADELKLKLD